jgi:hypothetical protein
MKLSVALPFRQLLSAAFGALLVAGSALAQQAADVIILKAAGPTAQPRPIANGVVMRVVGTRVMIREGTGEIGYELAQIQEIKKNPPAEFVQGMRLIEAGDMAGALTPIKAVADNFKGLPVTWAQDATAMLGNIYLSLNELSKAESAFADFKRVYSGAGSLATSVGEARVAAAKKRYSDAKNIAEPIVKEAMGKKNISRSESQLFGQAYFVLGQVAEGQNKLPEAMEHYCRVVAVFYQERSVVVEAQKRIDDLRQKGITTP